MQKDQAGSVIARCGGATARPCRLPNPFSGLILPALLLVASGIAGLATAEDTASGDVIEHAVIAPLAERSLLLDAAAADGLLVAVGDRGHILRSTDGGSTWKQAEVPTRATLTGVFFHNSSLGWAVGHHGVILKTVDGGVTWKRVRWAPEEENPLLEVWFSSSEEGFAVGAYGTFLVTSDGGETWTFKPISEEDFHLHHMARFEDGRLFMAAEAGLIYGSDDGGASWFELPSPYEGSFFGTLPIDDETLLLFGLRGHMFRSSDGGDSWTAVETGTVAMLNSGIRLHDGTVVVVGLGGTLLASKDDGHTFSTVAQPSRRGIQAVVAADESTLVLVGEFGVRTLPVSEIPGRGGVSP